MTVSPTPTPAPVPVAAPVSATADAKSRALRTAIQGLIVDVSVAVVGVATTAVADVRWTRAYWAALGLLVAKTAVQSAVSYVARRVVPPATS